MEFWTVHHPFIVGTVVVAVTSYTRFNSPPTSRGSTTWARYHALASLYTLTLLVTWLLISNREVVTALASNAGVRGLEGLDLPIYAAVLLTIVAQVPPLSGFDGRVRAILQEFARIPWEAKRLSEALQARTWLPDETFRMLIRQDMLRAGFPAGAVSFSCDRTPEALWTRVAALERYIATWKTRRGKFAGFHFANQATIDELRIEAESLERNAKRVLPLLAAARQHHASGVELELEGTLVTALERLQRNLCDLVSRGVLTCCVTGRARRDEFETIGFVVNVTPSRLFDNLLGLHLALTALYVAVLAAAGRPNPFPTGLSIATTYVGAVVLAMLWKRGAWAEQWPVLIHVLAAASAFGVALLSSFGLNVLTSGGDAVRAWQELRTRLWPWALMSAGIATWLVHALDRDDTRYGRRWESAWTAGLCLALSGPVVWLLRRLACETLPCDPPPYWRVMATATVMGGLIGWFAPTWFREPETMTSEYAHWKLRVSVSRRADGVVAVVDAVPPGVPGGTTAPVRLPYAIECASNEDAIAEAIRRARGWIDAQGAPTVAAGDVPLDRCVPPVHPPVTRLSHPA